MKKSLVILLLLITGFSHPQAQTVSSIIGSAYDHHYRVISVRNIPLFDAAEIKARGIKRCYIIHPCVNWKKETYRTDTLYIYDFDRMGTINRQIRFLAWDPARKDTIEGEFSEKRYYSSIDSTISMQNDLTTVTKYYSWAFNPFSEEIDTGKICKKIYDPKRRMIELKMNGTVDFHMINFCGTGMTFHDKYRYDENDRIIYYQDVRWKKYATFSYHPHHRVVRVYDSLSHQLEAKYKVHVNVNSYTIVEKTDETATLTRLSKDSRLFSLFTLKRGSPIPDEYFLIYEYFDKSLLTEKLLVKQ